MMEMKMLHKNLVLPSWNESRIHQYDNNWELQLLLRKCRNTDYTGMDTYCVETRDEQSSIFQALTPLLFLT